MNTWLAAALSAIPIFAALVLKIKTNATFFTLARDPSAVAGTAPHLGFLSQIGIFFWASAAAICIFSGYVLSEAPNTGRISSYLLMSGYFSLFLAIDDIFLVHDYLLPVIFKISERALFAAYAAFAIWLFAKNRALVRASNWYLLAVSFAAFGLSIIIDIPNYPSEYRVFFEDGAKLVGIVYWMVYFGSVSADEITHRFGTLPAAASTSTSKLAIKKITAI